MKNRKVSQITSTALDIAILIGFQAASAALGQLVTGSLVNLTLIMSVMTCGLMSGLTVSLVSPVFAKLLGIGTPLWSLIPFIMLGNAALVIVWHYVCKMKFANVQIVRITALISAAGVKFLVLYFGIVKIAIPFLLDLPASQATAISGAFSVTQLVTASIGGAVAIAILPVTLKYKNKIEGRVEQDADKNK
ncbi:MAG: hypothetical protein FWH14_02950 [Oscillospiraceae bacterium]|nr:hypothetical protein [Oscillospiraceae bacterium]